MRDITDIKQFNNELLENQRRFRHFFENIAFYGYVVTTDGTLLDINNAALSTLGYEKDELVGKPISIIYAEESIHEAQKLFDEWKLTGQARNAELVIKTKNGGRRWVILNVGAVRDANGNIVHSTSIQVDITDRKLTQRVLEESEKRYNSLFNNINDAVYSHKIMPNGEPGNFLHFNHAALKMSGYTPEELISMSPRELDDPDASIQYLPTVMKQLLEDIASKFESVQITKDGRRINVEVSTSIAEIGGEDFILSVCRDINCHHRHQWLLC